MVHKDYITKIFKPLKSYRNVDNYKKKYVLYLF